jgi:hypothetical protein
MLMPKRSQENSQEKNQNRCPAQRSAAERSPVRSDLIAIPNKTLTLK